MFAIRARRKAINEKNMLNESKIKNILQLIILEFLKDYL
jgi:hypothetical protein